MGHEPHCDLTALLAFTESERYANLAGHHPGAGPGAHRILAGVEHGAPLPDVVALRVAIGRAGFRYRPPYRHAAGRADLLRARLGSGDRAGLRHAHEGR